MNISEFERQKPTETMAALNKLIKRIKEDKEFSFLQKTELLDDLHEIKKLFKEGK